MLSGVVLLLSAGCGARVDCEEVGGGWAARGASARTVPAQRDRGRTGANQPLVVQGRGRAA